MINVLVGGNATGATLVLDAPISFWGGVSPETGTIIEKRHPQFNANLKGKILMLPAAKGSSSGSSVLAEILRNGCGPAAIILGSPDAILATGAMVAEAPKPSKLSMSCQLSHVNVCIIIHKPLAIVDTNVK